VRWHVALADGRLAAFEYREGNTLNHLLEWVGHQVRVSLRSTEQVTGNLVAVDELGVVLEIPKGPMFIPMTAVMHVSTMIEQ
jgi:hypothetical protein